VKSFKISLGNGAIRAAVCWVATPTRRRATALSFLHVLPQCLCPELRHRPCNPRHRPCNPELPVLQVQMAPAVAEARQNVQMFHGTPRKRTVACHHLQVVVASQHKPLLAGFSRASIGMRLCLSTHSPKGSPAEAGCSNFPGSRTTT